MERNHNGKLSWTKFVAHLACWTVKCRNCLNTNPSASHTTVTPAICVLKFNSYIAHWISKNPSSNSQWNLFIILFEKWWFKENEFLLVLMVGDLYLLIFCSCIKKSDWKKFLEFHQAVLAMISNPLLFSWKLYGF